MKSTWKLIGTIIKRTSKGQVYPTRIKRNEKTYTKDTDIAEQFNQYFINVGPNLASMIENTDDRITKYIKDSPISSFTMSPVSRTQVHKLFSVLNENKTTIDIPNKLIKIASETLSTPFTQIYNKSIEMGVVPDILKISRVTPIYKSGSPVEPGNYRPIAILSPFSKVLEQLVYKQLQAFLEKYNILYKYQFGFRKGHSTEQAILEITDNLKLAIDNKQITCGLFLDFSKAFDTVNHEILLAKLYAYGIRGLPLKWFENYLHNRTQYVKIGDVESNLETIVCGVPQGSTLGPLLFLLYINDMPNCSDKLSFRIFADDTNVFFSSNNVNELENVMNTELKLILQYCAMNKLSVNFKKTNYILFTSSRKKVQINIRGIEYKNYIKYLGIYIDEHLTWEPQIKHVNNKVAKNLAIINKLRYYLSLRVIKQLYYALIYPYLNYGLMSWGNTYKTRLTKLSTKQNKCVRSIFFANNRENANNYYSLLEILNLQNIFKCKMAVFAFKILNDKESTSVVFADILKPVSEIHMHNTRYSANQNLHRPKVRTNYGIFTFKFTISKIWETIPTEIKNSIYYSSFKIHYKKHLLKNQTQ